MNIRNLLTGSAIVLGAALTLATPAEAQQACDVNGVAGVPDGAQGTDSLICGNSMSSGSPANNLTAVGVDFSYTGNGVTLLGSNAIVQSNGGLVGSATYARPAAGGR